jgi:hypothetical protein
MRDDFCAFILTHGRPDKVLTYRGFVEAYSRRINEFRLDQHIRRYI